MMVKFHADESQCLSSFCDREHYEVLVHSGRTDGRWPAFLDGRWVERPNGMLVLFASKGEYAECVARVALRSHLPWSSRDQRRRPRDVSTSTSQDQLTKE